MDRIVGKLQDICTTLIAQRTVPILVFCALLQVADVRAGEPTWLISTEPAVVLTAADRFEQAGKGKLTFVVSSKKASRKCERNFDAAATAPKVCFPLDFHVLVGDLVPGTYTWSLTFSGKNYPGGKFTFKHMQAVEINN